MNDGKCGCEDQDNHQVKDKYKIKYYIKWQVAFENIESDSKPFFAKQQLTDDFFQKFEIVFKFNEKL